MKIHIVILFIILFITNCQQNARFILQSPKVDALYALHTFTTDYHLLKQQPQSPYYEVEYIGPTTDSQLLEEMGFKIVSMEIGKPFQEINAPPKGYTHPRELMEKFSEMAKNYSKIAKLINLNKEYNMEPTWDKNEIYALKISDNVEQDEDEPNVLIVSNHHARELITPEIALDTAMQLLINYDKDPAITRIVNENQIYIIW